MLHDEFPAWPLHNGFAKNPSNPGCDSTGQKFGALRDHTLLLIGDSVDHYLMLDWCRESRSRSLCTYLTADPQRDQRYHRRESDDCAFFDAQISTLGLPSDEIDLFGPGVCTDPLLNMSLMMLWNAFGVNGAGPFAPILVELYSPVLPSVEPGMHPNPALRRILQPIIQTARHLMDKPPAALVIQSAFWDLYRLSATDLHALRVLRSSSSARMDWVQRWLYNATELVSVAKELTRDWHVKWQGWRTSNFVIAGADDEDWRSDSRNLLAMMNTAGRQLAQSMDMHIVDLALFEGADNLRDRHHPAISVSAAFANALLKNVSFC